MANQIQKLEPALRRDENLSGGESAGASAEAAVVSSQSLEAAALPQLSEESKVQAPTRGELQENFAKVLIYRGERDFLETAAGMQFCVTANGPVYTVKGVLGSGVNGHTVLVEAADRPGQQLVMKFGHAYTITETRHPPPPAPQYGGLAWLGALPGKILAALSPASWFGSRPEEKTTSAAEILLEYKINTARRGLREIAAHTIASRKEASITLEDGREAPSVPRLFEVKVVPNPTDRAERLPVLVMEFIPGKTVTEFIRTPGLKDHPEVMLGLIENYISAVESLHRLGILHLDEQNTDNLFVRDVPGGGPERHAGMLLDLDCAHLPEVGRRQTKNGFASPLPAAFDGYTGNAPTVREDFYRLGKGVDEIGVLAYNVAGFSMDVAKLIYDVADLLRVNEIAAARELLRDGKKRFAA